MTYGRSIRNKGAYYEQIAAAYLSKCLGYDILELNFKSRFGEIDIIAKDGEYLVFVEVKYRDNSQPSHGVLRRRFLVRQFQLLLMIV